MKRVHLPAILVLIIALCLAGCGKTGPAGPQGEQGQQGEQGIPGADGSIIYSGNGAPAADLGQAGDYYLDKNKSDLYGPKTDKGWGTAIPLKGEKGDQGDTGAKGNKGDTGAKGNKGDAGKDGSQILSGTTKPIKSIGRVGDYYWNTSTFILYGPKTASGWGSGVMLRGPQGPKGEKGDKGDPGNANVISSGWLGIDDLNAWVQMKKNYTTFSTFSEPGDFSLMVDYYNPFRIEAKNTGGVILVYVQLPFNTIRLCPFEFKMPAVATPPPFPLKMKFRFVIQKSGDDYLLCRVVALRESGSTADFYYTVIEGGFSWKIVIIPPTRARKSSPPPDPKDYKATCAYYGIAE